jgi:histidine triad (HIT) family protein
MTDLPNKSIFTKIIDGEVPAYKVYEDEMTLAFLDIFPKSSGHVLVIPKIQIDKIYDLPDDYYRAIWDTARKLAAHMDKVLGKRTFMKVIGTDVPHAHIHLIPQDDNYTDQPIQASDKELSAMADKLRLV